MPWLDLLGLNVMAGATVLGVPVKQMLTTENVAGEVKSSKSQINCKLWHEMQIQRNGKYKIEFTQSVITCNTPVCYGLNKTLQHLYWITIRTLSQAAGRQERNSTNNEREKSNNIEIRDSGIFQPGRQKD